MLCLVWHKNSVISSYSIPTHLENVKNTWKFVNLENSWNFILDLEFLV